MSHLRQANVNWYEDNTFEIEGFLKRDSIENHMKHGDTFDLDDCPEWIKFAENIMCRSYNERQIVKTIKGFIAFYIYSHRYKFEEIDSLDYSDNLDYYELVEVMKDHLISIDKFPKKDPSIFYRISFIIDHEKRLFSYCNEEDFGIYSANFQTFPSFIIDAFNTLFRKKDPPCVTEDDEKAEIIKFVYRENSLSHNLNSRLEYARTWGDHKTAKKTQDMTIAIRMYNDI